MTTDQSITLNTRLISNLNRILYISPSEINEATSIANSTWYRITQLPDGISIQQLLLVANGLNIPVSRFFNFGSEDEIGKKSDYVVKEGYIKCYYDEDELQRLVSSDSKATWKHAADTIGMTSTRLKESLLSITRTPVKRFLSVCKVFHVDPFTILIDPNARTENRRCTSSTAIKPEEIEEMQKRIDSLSAKVSDLTEKYLQLLDRQNELEDAIKKSTAPAGSCV